MTADFYDESGYPFDRDRHRQAFGGLLRRPELVRAWIAKASQDAVGYVVLTFSFTMEYGGFSAFIDDLFVVKPMRRRRIGLALLEEAMRECLNRGVFAVHLEAGRDNFAAQLLYARYGFKEADCRLLTLQLNQQISRFDD